MMIAKASLIATTTCSHNAQYNTPKYLRFSTMDSKYTTTMMAASNIIDDESFLASTAMMQVTDSQVAAVSLDARILSGTVGSIVSAVVSQPFEVTKIQQQQQHQQHQRHNSCTTHNTHHYRPLPARPPLNHVVGSSSCTSCTTKAPPFYMLYSTSATGARRPSPATPMGAIGTLRSVIAREGLGGAYRGIVPTVIMAVPNYVLYLTVYDDIVAKLRANNSNANNSKWHFSETSIPLIGGALARMLATTVVAPLELLRTRHASGSDRQPEKQSSMVSELHKIVRQDGVRGLYRGILPFLSRDVPFAAIYMLVLERFRDVSRPVLLPDTSSRSESPYRQVQFEFVSAALSGMVAATCTQPLDVIKTRLQSYNAATANGRAAPGTVETVRSIVQREGLSGLWRGNQARMMKVAPQYAIMISFYEVGKKVLDPEHHH